VSVAWWVAALTLGPLGLVAVIIAVVAIAGSLLASLCAAAASADRDSDELLCRRLQEECRATPLRQPVGGAELVSDRLRRGYRGPHR
jgi:dihydrodipicolinate synthase/N-acetylneuraminate lyase